MLSNGFNKLPILSGMNNEQRAILNPLFTENHKSSGSIIFNQGDLAEFLYFLIEGEINLRYKPEDGPEINLTSIKPNDVFGWSSVLGRQTYTSSAICASDCRMVRIRGKNLVKLCENNPDTGAVILERLSAIIPERMQGHHIQMQSMIEQKLRYQVNPATSGK
jgi:CRP/FNR family transcriptional regulator